MDRERNAMFRTVHTRIDADLLLPLAWLAVTLLGMGSATWLAPRVSDWAIDQAFHLGWVPPYRNGSGGHDLLVLVLAGLIGGLPQALVLRAVLPGVGVRQWLGATVLAYPLAYFGSLIIFAILDSGLPGSRPIIPISYFCLTAAFLATAGAVGGAMLALPQWLALRAHLPQAIGWIAINIGAGVLAAELFGLFNTGGLGVGGIYAPAYADISAIAIPFGILPGLALAHLLWGRRWPGVGDDVVTGAPGTAV
jgi:hypothetical protein